MNWNNFNAGAWMPEQPRQLSGLGQLGQPQQQGWVNPNPIAYQGGMSGTPQVQGWVNPNPIGMNQPSPMQGFQGAGGMPNQQPRQFGNRLADLGGNFMPRQSMYQRMW